MEVEKERLELEQKLGYRLPDSTWKKIKKYVESGIGLKTFTRSQKDKFEMAWFVLYSSHAGYETQLNFINKSLLKHRVETLENRWLMSRPNKVKGSEVRKVFKELTGLEPDQNTVRRWAISIGITWSERQLYTTKELLPLAKRMFIYVIREIVKHKNIKTTETPKDSYPFETINTRGIKL